MPYTIFACGVFLYYSNWYMGKRTGKPKGRPKSSVRSARSIYMLNCIWEAIDRAKLNRSALSEKLHREYLGFDTIDDVMF